MFLLTNVLNAKQVTSSKKANVSKNVVKDYMVMHKTNHVNNATKLVPLAQTDLTVSA